MKKLYLSKDKKISGLCGGIGEYFEIDPNLVRLVWVVMTIISGVFPGVLAYIIAVLFIPKESELDGGTHDEHSRDV